MRLITKTKEFMKKVWTTLKNWWLESLGVLMAIFGIGAVILLSTGAQALEFQPDCNYLSTPPMSGWLESSYDSGLTEYCLYDNETFYIKQPAYKNFAGDWFTSNPTDIYTTFNITEQSNVRNVIVTIEYYQPSIQEVDPNNSSQIITTCLSNTTNPVTNLPQAPATMLLANHNNGFADQLTFDESTKELNYILVCDQWDTISYTVQQFSNGYGSSFSGSSKTLGSFGFELGNVYIRSVNITSSEGTIEIW